MPHVSVIIPTYNRLSVLPLALRSATCQTVQPFEIIVVDDGSNDGTVDMLARDWPQVTVIRLEKRHGAPFARNVGIDAARGTFIAFLDSDDIFMPNKLERQLLEMRRTGAKFSTCAFRTPDNRIYAHQPAPRVRMLRKNGMGGTSGLLAQSNLLRRCRFDPTMRAVQDWELFLRLNIEANGVHCTEPLFTYGIDRADRITRHKRRRLIGHIQLYNRHIRTNLKATLRDHLAHRALQAMLRADLANRQYCKLGMRALYHMLTI